MLQHLETVYQNLSRKTAQVELEYNAAGVVFYILTICDDRDQGQNTHFFRKAFWADSDNTIIPQIHQVRQRLPLVRPIIRSGNVDAAIFAVEDLDDRLNDLAEEIVALQVHVTTLSSHLTTSPTRDSLLCSSTAQDLQAVRNHPRFREWALKLPEVEHAMQLGIMENAEQTVGSLLEIEDRLE